MPHLELPLRTALRHLPRSLLLSAVALSAASHGPARTSVDDELDRDLRDPRPLPTSYFQPPVEFDGPPEANPYRALVEAWPHLVREPCPIPCPAGAALVSRLHTDYYTHTCVIDDHFSGIAVYDDEFVGRFDENGSPISPWVRSTRDGFFTFSPRNGVSTGLLDELPSLLSQPPTWTAADCSAAWREPARAEILRGLIESGVLVDDRGLRL